MDSKKIKKILDILFPEIEITIENVECLPRQQLNENNEYETENQTNVETYIDFLFNINKIIQNI